MILSFKTSNETAYVAFIIKIASYTHAKEISFLSMAYFIATPLFLAVTRFIYYKEAFSEGFRTHIIDEVLDFSNNKT